MSWTAIILIATLISVWGVLGCYIFQLFEPLVDYAWDNGKKKRALLFGLICGPVVWIPHIIVYLYLLMNVTLHWFFQVEPPKGEDG